MDCAGCELAVADCLCPERKVSSRLAVTVLMHPLERGRASNTGRLAPLVLERATLAIAEREIDESLVSGAAVLLWPGGAPATAERMGGIDRVIALDGTWGQARRMRARVGAIARLPSVTLPARPEQRRLRRPRDPAESSTGEAIAIALELAGDVEAAAAVRRACHALIDVLTRPGRPRGDLVQ